MGSLSLVARPSVQLWARQTPTVAQPAPAAAYPALAGITDRSACGGTCGGACGNCAGRPDNALARLNDSLAPYTDLLWWAWAAATLVGVIRHRRAR